MTGKPRGNDMVVYDLDGELEDVELAETIEY